MGIVQRQGIKNSIVNYIGVIAGALSTMFIYPLDIDLYGSIQVWIASAALLIPFLTLGTPSLVFKFFPYFQQNKVRGFFKIMIQLTALIVLIMSVFLFFIKEYIFKSGYFSQSNVEAYQSFLGIIYPISVLLIFNSLFRAQAANHKRIVVPDLIQKIGFKIFLPIIFIATIWQYTSVFELKIGLVGFYLFILIFYIFYLIKINGIDYKGSEAIVHVKQKKKEMGSYMIFNILNTIGDLLAYQIDKIMLGSIISNAAAGVYSIFFFLTTIIEIPTRAIFQISGPIVSDLFEKGDTEEINDMYKKSSINLFIVGTLIFSLIWINIDNIFMIMSKGDDIKLYKYLFLFLGLAKLMDMLTSINGFIIIYSKYYKYNLIFLGVMAIVNLVSNYYLISSYGIIGAGIATSISIFTYNLVRSSFIYIKMKMHPFSIKQLTIFTIMLIVILFSNYFSLPFHPIINVIMSSSIFMGIYLPIIYFTKSSYEINKMIDNLMSYVRK